MVAKVQHPQTTEYRAGFGQQGAEEGELTVILGPAAQQWLAGQHKIRSKGDEEILSPEDLPS